MAIARAVIARPDLLVADEPTGNVDSDMAARLLHLFAALNELGTTVVVATHDVGLINATPGAQLIRLEDGALADPDRIAPQSAAAGAAVMIGWLTPPVAERRILGGARLRSITPWIVAVMSFTILLVAACGLLTARAAGELKGSIGQRYVLTVPAGGGDVDALAKRISAMPGVARGRAGQLKPQCATICDAGSGPLPTARICRCPR